MHVYKKADMIELYEDMREVLVAPDSHRAREIASKWMIFSLGCSVRERVQDAYESEGLAMAVKAYKAFADSTDNKAHLEEVIRKWAAEDRWLIGQTVEE